MNEYISAGVLTERKIKNFALVGQQFKLAMTQKIKTSRPKLSPIRSKKIFRSAKVLVRNVNSPKIYNERIGVVSSKFQEELVRKLRLRF